ncbi:MAG TPA: GNAT family N-acetyltransferase [Mucilaginibacter sp.]|nr:GNAT family N-acetyltransferase [Mucilaginibacter sp.]
MKISIEQIRPELTWYLRQKVLYPTQKLYEMEMDEDQNGIHFGVFTDNKLVAVVSLFDHGGDFQFRKLAVDPDYQGKGIGNTLLTYITNFSKNEGGHRIWCNARDSAYGFYLKAGFAHVDKPFSKNGFNYDIMEKPL